MIEGIARETGRQVGIYLLALVLISGATGAFLMWSVPTVWQNLHVTWGSK